MVQFRPLLSPFTLTNYPADYGPVTWCLESGSTLCQP